MGDKRRGGMEETERFTKDTREESRRSERSGGHPEGSSGGIGRLGMEEAGRFICGDLGEM
jgi:hypothetical protein